ncbi:MAG TPA: hypothetical protein VF816_17045 [Rhodocyclaceae bacterium]
MKPSTLAARRFWLVALVLVLAAVAGWWIGESPEAEAPRAAAPAPAERSLPPSRQSVLPQQQHTAAPVPQPGADIFAVHTWEPPPPPLPPAGFVAPPPPQAPPLPFRFLGRIAEPGKPQVFLLVEGDHVVSARLGQPVGGAYRLEKFEGGQLFFRYRPMNQVQTLPTGSMP